MPFLTKEKRLAHRIWGKIPEEIWSDLFESMSLQDARLIEFLISKLGNIESAMSTINRNFLSLDVAKAWITVVITFGSMSLMDKTDLADKLRVKVCDLFKYACVINDKDVINHYLSKLSSMEDFTTAFRWASRYCNFEFIKSILELAQENNVSAVDMLTRYDFLVFKEVSSRGRLEVANFFLKLAQENNIDPATMLRANNFAVFREASRHGQLGVVMCLMELAQEIEVAKKEDGFPVEMLRAGELKDFKTTLKNSCFWLSEIMHSTDAVDREMLKVFYLSGGTYTFAAYREASRHGYADVVAYLVDIAHKYGVATEMLRTDNFLALQLACENGCFEVVEFILAFAQQNGFAAEMLRANNYGGWKAACENDRLEVVESILAFAEQNGLAAEILRANNFLYFIFASERGYFKVVDFLMTAAKQNGLAAEMLGAYNFGGFLAACKNDRFEVVESILAFAEQNGLAAEILRANNYEGWKAACKNDRLEVVESILAFAEQNGLAAEMIRANNYEVFRWSLEHGKFEVVGIIMKLAKQNEISIAEMLRGYSLVELYDSSAIQLASLNGNFELVDSHFMEFAEQNRLAAELLRANNYGGFQWASQHGHFELAVCLMEIAQQNGFVEELLRANNYGGVQWASSNGRVELVECFMAFAEQKGLAAEMLRADSFMGGAYKLNAFQRACRKDRLEVVESILAFAQKNGLAAGMIRANNYEVFRWSLEHGKFEVVGIIMKFAKQNKISIAEMLKGCCLVKWNGFSAFQHDFSAFQWASSNGQFELVVCLMEIAQQNGFAAEMLRAEDFVAFQGASQHGYPEVVDFLMTAAKQNGLAADMLRAKDFAAFRWADQDGRTDVVNYLLTFQEVSSYAAENRVEAGLMRHYPVSGNRYSFSGGRSSPSSSMQLDSQTYEPQM